MQHTSAAQQQPGEKPTLAPSATQNTPKAQARAMIPTPTFKHPRSRLRDTNAASWKTGVRKKQTSSASETRPACPHGWALQPMQQHGLSITSMLLRKWRGDILSSLPGLHNTIPSGKDTGRLAQSSDLCRRRSTGHNPCQRHKDSSRNSYQARCERGIKDNRINHGRNKQAA